MGAVFISVVLICRAIQAIFNKKSGNEITSVTALLGFTSYQCAISAALGLALVVISGAELRLDLMTVLIALLAGVMLFLAMFLTIWAMQGGTVSLSSMFGTAGIIIPILAGIFLFNQPMHAVQWLGVAMFFVAAWLLIGSSKEIFGRFSVKTFAILICTLLSNGGAMLAQQMFTTYVPDGNVSVFSFLAFSIVAAISFIVYLFAKRNDGCSREARTKKQKQSIMISGAMLALAVFVLNQITTASAALIPPVILFTFINGGGTIVSTLVGALMYGERLSAKSVAGVILGVISLVVIKLF